MVMLQNILLRIDKSSENITTHINPLKAKKSQKSKSRYNFHLVCLNVESLMVLMTRCLLLFGGYCPVFMGRPL
jgi:hypothetical protein